MGHAGHETYSYSYTHSPEYGRYKFIAMDACLSFGPRKPLNFFGVLHNVRCIYTSHVYIHISYVESHASSIHQYELNDRVYIHTPTSHTYMYMYSIYSNIYMDVYIHCVHYITMYICIYM